MKAKGCGCGQMLVGVVLTKDFGHVVTTWLHISEVCNLTNEMEHDDQ